MAEFKISRIRYTWRNAWATSTTYNRDDIIRYGGSSYICLRQHTSSTFANDQAYVANQNDTVPTPAWTKMTDGRAWRGQWNSSTLYNSGDLSLYGGVIYLCVTSHTSQATFLASASNWAVYLSADNWRADWTPSTTYGVGDVIKYNGTVYRCIVEHSSGLSNVGIEANQEAWQIIYSGIEFRGSWESSTRYALNDLVKYGPTIFRCTTPHTSSETFSGASFAVEFLGLQFYTDWSSVVYYAVGDIVRRGGDVFVATSNNYNQIPSQSIYQPVGTPAWRYLCRAINFRGEFSYTTTYRTGDVIRRGGNIYKALIDTENDLSTLDYLDATNWEIITVSQNFQGPWVEDETYEINDVVVFLGSTYSANIGHTSTDQNFPGDNGSGFAYWDLVLQSGANVGMTTRGDLLTFDLSKTAQGDGSTFGITRIPVGVNGQLLSVDAASSIEYKTFGNIARTVYVDVDGIDDILDTQRGYSPFKPWRTIRFACEQVDDNFSGTTTVTVGPGVFEEVTPIIVPARTVVLGIELRTTTIKAAGPVLAYASDSTYTLDALNRIFLIIQDIIAGEAITKTAANTLNQTVLVTSVVSTVSFNPPQFDENGNEIYQSSTTTLTPIETDPQAATDIQLLISDIENYIDFYVNSGAVDPATVGTNTANITTGYTNAVLVLRANKQFLAEEAIAYTETTYPDYEFDAEQYRRDFERYIEAFAYDIIYTGNYKSLLEARYYRNRVLGCSETEDMFYVRDTTGIRNCTLKGLESELNPPVAFDLYQKPLGGAYVSLDPGWGPADTRVWITNRSPYIQGVTTIGTGCVGQKIDGALHAGGNRSITSNDFTQVLSDGIGAWVLNNGRAELVSVFTYYAHIGYLAEDGGIIRATNGNCSYGNFGAIADGVDDTETPASATINTRNQQASIAEVFAGDFVDEIQILEWSNFGENYTTASAAFVGAGVDAAVVFDEFRDDAIFQTRLLDTNAGTAQIAQAIGGGGYIVVQNNAQTGDDLTITIASNDANSFAEYDGMRIIITSGAGTGQYGYIAAYDNVTKVITVYRESDDQPGWDHVIPGKLPTVPLLPNTTYRIEPRVLFSAPPYSAIEITVPVSTTWSEIVFGNTTESYTDRAVNESGTGITIEVAAALASFDVIKTGREYAITINNAGAGYAVGQILTIDGDALGGATPINDLTILVTAVSDDSTNSILAAQINQYGPGENDFASSGKFVAVSTGGSAALYSSDGVEWISFNMPSAGDWTCLAAGDNKFVAVRRDSAVAASSLDGIAWTTRAMPASRSWKSCIYGSGLFLAIASDSNSAAYSLNGTSWTTTVLPGFGDSTLNEWIDVAYGKNRYVVLANSNNTVVTGSYNSTLNTWSWAGHLMDVVADSSAKDWVSIAYGNDRFVAISSTGDVAYSFDGESWLPATMPSQDGSTAHNWKKIRYAQGVFFAIGDTGGRNINADPTAGPTNYAAQSADGIAWTSRTLASSKEWVSVAFGSPYVDSRDSTVGRSTPTWIAIDNSDKFNKIQTGARALGRVTLSSGIIRSVKMWDPGSGYIDQPTLTLVDPNNTSDLVVECRVGDGVLAQPSWLNRGLGYRTLSTFATIAGDGYGDDQPSGKFIVIDNLDLYPGPGASLSISGLTGFYTLVAIEELGTTDRKLAARIRVSPELKVRNDIQHNKAVSIRTQVSQCRITGHDFLDIGTGNFEETNYPLLYSGFYTASPENEVVELNRGRVFYTSTDQSGNFRAGELFSVEQSTGTVSISSDFFDLNGLSELRLGGIRVGGTGAVVREFSTDPLFVEDSNNIVPTQRAIRAYLAGRLSVGGSELVVGSFIAGTILVGPDRINNVAGLKIVFPLLTEFNMEKSGISGSMLAQTMFFRSFYE
jgi:hypothetical protein